MELLLESSLDTIVVCVTIATFVTAFQFDGKREDP